MNHNIHFKQVKPLDCLKIIGKIGNLSFMAKLWRVNFQILLNSLTSNSSLMKFESQSADYYQMLYALLELNKKY